MESTCKASRVTEGRKRRTSSKHGTVSFTWIIRMHEFRPLFPFQLDFLDPELTQVINTKCDGHVYTRRLSLHVNKSLSRHSAFRSVARSSSISSPKATQIFTRDEHFALNKHGCTADDALLRAQGAVQSHENKSCRWSYQPRLCRDSKMKITRNPENTAFGQFVYVRDAFTDDSVSF